GLSMQSSYAQQHGSRALHHHLFSTPPEATEIISDDPVLWPKAINDNTRCQINLANHLKQHEYSKIYCENMRSWHDLLKRLQTKTTIDLTHQNLLHIEIEHWKDVIRRVISISCHLAERNQALRGPSNMLNDHHNGNFLSLVELMAHGVIQNEIINLVGDKTLEEILRRVTKAKYFSVIMDCTPDISHKEELSIVLRIVTCEPSVGVSIAEHFTGFFDIEDTTGKGLTETLLDHMQKHNLNISDCCGPSYDNGSNMVGQKQGVQERILQSNSKALLYNVFSSSVQCWAILKEHVKLFSLKPLSSTRWEARIESVKVVRYQLPQILQALLALQTFAVEKRDSETMSTANALHNELKSWGFLMCTIIRYNVLYQVNLVSKLLQSPDASLETLKTETQGLRQYLENFRDTAPMHDIDAADLELEINSAVYTFPDHASTCPNDILNYIYSEDLLELYSNLSIALRLLLTLPVSVASGERKFSALKLIKTYLRSTMCQERLTGLALISIERAVLRSSDMEDIVAAFAEAAVLRKKKSATSGL
uniref:HAT C-terminal dimerisation domain-containing protein n=1 Tax=Gouania willdenowi TaxID=441366 RepID=A0A8C5EEX0_GOUWI